MVALADPPWLLAQGLAGMGTSLEQRRLEGQEGRRRPLAGAQALLGGSVGGQGRAKLVVCNGTYW